MHFQPGKSMGATPVTSRTPSTAAGSHDLHAHHHGNGQISQELTLKVEGMHCASCAVNVHRALVATPGVRSASVNVTDGRATVVGNDLNPDALVQAVRSTGYEAQAIIELPAPAELKSEIELRQAQHEREWKRRAIIGLSVWAPLEALHWIGQAAGWHAAHGSLHWMDWLSFIGATVVIIIAGGGFYRSAWGAAMRFTTNMDTLIAMGATTAYVYSLVIFLMRLSGSHVDHPLYFNEASALLGIISLGHWLEARATARAGSAVRELLELQPDHAEVIQRAEVRDQKSEVRGQGSELRDQKSEIRGQGSEQMPALGRPPIAMGGRQQPMVIPSAQQPMVIPSADVRPGDHILIRPGVRVPVDGIVIEGESEVDESVVTGESLPITKRPNDAVVAGSMNTLGRLIVRATVDGRHTTVARIADMVQRAQSSKANIQRLADFIASIFVPTVLAIATLTLVGWSIAGDFPKGVIATVTVLIISCPCALGLATPMAVMVGAGAASKAGVLVKSAMAFETAGRATHVIFDKTGTLTAGQPVLSSIEPAGGASLSERDLLRLAAAVEAPSEHPIARAVVRAAHDRQIDIPPVTEFKALPGEGVRGVVDGREIKVARDEHATARIEVNGTIAGTLTVSDQLRPDASHAVDQLRAMGLQVMLLSGDRQHVAQEIGASLGLDAERIIAEATPESKVEFVQRLSHSSTDAGNQTSTQTSSRAKPQAAGTIMVGDGINDAAALAQADLGIALASGTNIAIESADVVIPSDRVTAVAHTIHIARQTLRTIKQNLFFAFFYNATAIPVAALGLLGPHGPLVAAAAMGLSDITVIGNAIRLKRRLARSAPMSRHQRDPAINSAAGA